MLIVFAALFVAPPTYANLITGIGKIIKGGEGVTAVTKTGATGKGAAAALAGSEIDDAGRLTKAHSASSGLSENSTNIFVQYPWQSIQLSKCITRLESRLGNKEASSACSAKYEKCAYSVERYPNLNVPIEGCVNTVNND